MKINNGITYAGCASTPHTIILWIDGQIFSSFDLWKRNKTGDQVRAEFTMRRKQFEQVIKRLTSC